MITPGKTTDQDVVWWLRQAVNDAGYGTWFQCSVMVQRPGTKEGIDFLHKENGIVIQRGDVLHTDFGITVMRLNTDTQHMGYVLRPGETDVPAGLKRALVNGNRLQDIVLERLQPGRTETKNPKGIPGCSQVEASRGRSHLQPSHRHHGHRPVGDRFMGPPGRSRAWRYEGFAR